MTFKLTYILAGVEKIFHFRICRSRIWYSGVRKLFSMGNCYLFPSPENVIIVESIDGSCEIGIRVQKKF